MITFRSEAYTEIPLPPEVSFEEAFSRLDPVDNSFYILSLDEESFMQCGGGASACTVEVRMADAAGRHRRYVVGRQEGSMAPARIAMSQGGPWVGQREVLTASDAVQLFAHFLAGDPLPPGYALRDPTTDKVVAPPGQPDRVEEEDEAPRLRWLAASHPENAFGIEGYDCAACVAARTTMTADANIARSFIERRTSSRVGLDQQLPDDAVVMDCELTYATTRPLAEGPVFRAAEMEDKWDIDRHGERLTFCRSWTGIISFVAELSLSESALTVRRVWAAGDLMATDAALTLRHFDYLIRSHVLGRRAPHPLPAELPHEPQAIEDYSFQQYGRNCCFASFEDTIAAPDFDASRSTAR